LEIFKREIFLNLNKENASGKNIPARLYLSNRINEILSDFNLIFYPALKYSFACITEHIFTVIRLTVSILLIMPNLNPQLKN
jgi:hypothetical protein